jgi:hypothetical protein
MKKILILMLALVMALSFAACGEDTAAPDQGSDVEETNEIPGVEFVDKEFGYITVSVPDSFGDVTEQEGMYVCAGPDASVVVTPTLGIDLAYSEWDSSLVEEYIQMIYGSTYTDLELSLFETDVDMNGNKTIYYACYGTNAEGTDRLIQVVRLFNADLTAQYMITFIHTADDAFYTAEVGGAIINSITLAPEAQNLEAEFEG